MTRFRTGVAALVLLTFSVSAASGALTAYWSFDEGYTSAVGLGMDGEAVGNVSITTAPGTFKFGGALAINDNATDTQHCVKINNPIAVIPNPIEDISQLPIITIAGWYNRTNIDGGLMDSWNYIWEAGSNFTVTASINSGDSVPEWRNPRWGYGAYTTFRDLTGPAVVDGQWYHMVTVLNPATRTAKYYHNGQLRDYRAVPEEYLLSLARSTVFYIGSSRYVNGSRNWDGYMDEVAVFDHEPSASVIAGLYSGAYTPATAPLTEATPVSIGVKPGWKLNDTIGFDNPCGLAVDNSGVLHVARRDSRDATDGVYRIESDGSATLVHGSDQRLLGLVVNPVNNELFFSQDLNEGAIYRAGDFLEWVVNLNNDGVDDDPAGLAIVPAGFNGGPGSLVQAGDALVVDYGVDGVEQIYVWSPTTQGMAWALHTDSDPADGVGSPLFEPVSIAVSQSTIFVADHVGNMIYKVSPQDGSLTPLTTSKTIYDPVAMAIDPVSGDLYVMIDEEDVPGSAVVRIDLTTGQVTTVVDMLSDRNEAPITPAFQWPHLAFSADGEHLYVGEAEADRIYDLLRSAEGPPGDANNDGKVDAADAAILAKNWLKTVSNGPSDGDFNSDTVVDDLDASILAANWVYTGSGGAAVPEPSTLAILLSMAVAFGASRLARRR